MRLWRVGFGPTFRGAVQGYAVGRAVRAFGVAELLWCMRYFDQIRQTGSSFNTRASPLAAAVFDFALAAGQQTQHGGKRRVHGRSPALPFHRPWSCSPEAPTSRFRRSQCQWSKGARRSDFGPRLSPSRIRHRCCAASIPIRQDRPLRSRRLAVRAPPKRVAKPCPWRCGVAPR